MAPHPIVHLVAGESAAGCVKLALGDTPSGCVVPIVDCLSCGPLQPLHSIAKWTELRRTFWRTVQSSDGLGAYPSLVPDRRALFNADEIHLWLGTGLSDQVAFVWVPQILRAYELDVARLRVVQFPKEFSPRHDTPSLAMLNPDDVRRQPAAQSMSDEQIHALDRTWRALSAATPGPLADLLADEMPSLPLVREALGAAHRRYPDAKSGLARWDERLLEAVRAEGPKAAYVIGHALSADGWQADPVGDGWLFWRLRRLANTALASPLIRLEGDVRHLRATSVRLTPTGERVLDGALNAADVNGVDDWVFGAHLDSSLQAVWFARGSELVPAGAV